MSFVTLAGNPSGTGTLTVSAPNTNSNRALALPDADGTLGVFGSEVHVHSANGYGSVNTQIRRFLTVNVETGPDITRSDSATLGTAFTVNKRGVYAISYSDSFVAAADMGISVNSLQLTTGIGNINAPSRLAETTTGAASYRGSVSATRLLQAGDVIRAHTNGVAVGTQTASTQFAVVRVA